MPVRTTKQDIDAIQEMLLPYPRKLAPFIRRAPLPVLVRSCLERLIDQATLERLFKDTAQEQYTREITLSLKALQPQHGQEAVQQLSYYQVVLEIAQTWKGMAIAVPTEQWEFVRRFTLAKLVRRLSDIAKLVPMDHFKRSRRGPKKPQPKRQSGKCHQHVSVKRLLDQAQLNLAC